MDERRSQKHYRNCPVVYALDILSKKWLIPIICELDHCETMRYTELAKVIPGITGMMLTSALKTLQNLGLVTRTQYNEVPLRVEYSLTKAGKSIMPSLFQLSSWSVDMMVDEGIEVTCSRNSCLAQVAQNVAANEENILRYRRSWDEEFDLLYREILENPQTASADPIEKLHLLVRGLLKAATSYGEQLSRMATIYYIIGEENSSDLLPPTGGLPHYGRPAGRGAGAGHPQRGSDQRGDPLCLHVLRPRAQQLLGAGTGGFSHRGKEHQYSGLVLWQPEKMSVPGNVLEAF